MKKLIFIGVFEEAWQELVRFLEVKEYQDEAMLKHMKEVLEGTEKK